LGTGISENIREVYSFIAANYTPGDEIVLIGFSRGAFTVRSVASIIRDIGLLTRRGMEYFYPIFKDQQNFKNEKYHDIFPDIPFKNKPFGDDAAEDYKQRLERVCYCTLCISSIILKNLATLHSSRRSGWNQDQSASCRGMGYCRLSRDTKYRIPRQTWFTSLYQRVQILRHKPFRNHQTCIPSTCSR